MTFSQSRQLFVSLYRIIVYTMLCAIFLLGFGYQYKNLLILNRSSVVVVASFIIISLFMTQIYGKLEIGLKKNKPIFYSFILNILVTDIITFLALRVMNIKIHFAILIDIAYLFLVFFVQIIALKILIKIGNKIYFANYSPNKTVIIHNNIKYAQKIQKYVRRHKLQYNLDKIISFSDITGLDTTQYDTFFLVDVDPLYCVKLISEVNNYPREVMWNYSEYDIIVGASKIIIIDDLMMNVYQARTMDSTQIFIKRLIDILISSIALLVAFPFLLISAIAIKLEDGGSIFYSQTRLTKDARKFEIRKLRSMKVNADLRPVEKNDDRITKVGRYIRAFRIDEIPQLFNILNGDMSLVGPRPTPEAETKKIIESLPEFKLRLNVKSGLTGYAQIYGKYNTDARSKLLFDLKYINDFSILTDLKIILQTPIVFLKKDSTEAFEMGYDFLEDDNIEKINIDN